MVIGITGVGGVRVLCRIVWEGGWEGCWEGGKVGVFVLDQVPAAGWMMCALRCACLSARRP